MAFFKTLFIASMAALAYAAPQSVSDGNTAIDLGAQDKEPKCGNGQELACCNSGEDLIGANCALVQVLAASLKQQCGSNVASCCQTGDSDGDLLNLEANCVAIPV